MDTVGFHPHAEETRTIESCNVCAGRRFVVLSHRDRYGFEMQAHGCRDCGLVFLNPVMTAAAYGRFYEGTYRPLVSAYHGRQIDAASIQPEQRVYADALGRLLAPFVDPDAHRLVLDVGGSTGIVAHALATRFGLRGTVLDPSSLELREAQRLGLDVVPGFVEDFDPGDRRYDVVVMCQTIDHLLDLTGTLRAIRAVMRPGGLFFADIVDLRAAYLRNWSFEAAVKVDHPYYLTEHTMEHLLARTGFEVLRSSYADDHLHVGYVCRPGEPATRLPSPSVVDAQWHEIRFVQNAPRPGRVAGE